MIKQFYFKQFNLALVICLLSVYMLNSSIWPIDRTLSDATTLGQLTGLLHMSFIAILIFFNVYMCHVVGKFKFYIIELIAVKLWHNII